MTSAHGKTGDLPSTYEGRYRDGRLAAEEADEADDVRGLADHGAIRWALGDYDMIKVPPT